MLGLSREQLDARNHALSEQVPQLQAQLAEAHRVNAGMQGEVTRAGDVLAQHIALQESYKTLAKRLAQLQEDHASLGDEVRLQREMAQSAEEEHALVAATLSRAKERVLALEREIKEMNNTHSQQRLNDQHSSVTHSHAHQDRWLPALAATGWLRAADWHCSVCSPC
jgi:DNA repair exonuclease SbcCD ATPase subunit